MEKTIPIQVYFLKEKYIAGSPFPRQPGSFFEGCYFNICPGKAEYEKKTGIPSKTDLFSNGG
ncbi:MAG TPA: hypothetical protein IAA08_06170 [Candidatus Eubacterium avistercoris]|uniref:Uncharacterized protein n=1 Tax=Candidatus Eubacterium avistercoris TaxID=2838567 RepID=A0A9D2D2V4_9FIRM|nr:hypothetical protein [Candidatus Eubacterium avistercoris]